MNTISVTPGNRQITFDLKRADSGFGYEPSFYNSICNIHYSEQLRYDFGKCYSEEGGEFVLVAMKTSRMSDPVTQYRLLQFNQNRTKLIEIRRIVATQHYSDMKAIYEYATSRLQTEEPHDET